MFVILVPIPFLIAALSINYFCILRRKREPADDDEDDDTNDNDNDAASSEEEGDDDDIEAEEDSDEESDDDDEDDDDFDTKVRASTAAAAKNSAPKTKSSKMTQVKQGRGGGAREKTKVATGRSPGSNNARGNNKSGAVGVGRGGMANKSSAMQRSAHQALAALAKNVLPEGEVPGLSSLVAGLLHSYRPTATKEHGVVDNTGNDNNNLPQLSEYTPNLVALARKVILVHNDHPNRAQLALLNLLFRSVGGGPQTDFSLGGLGSNKLKAKSKRGGGVGGGGTITDEDDEDTDVDNDDDDEEVILDDMDTDEWARVVTDLVDDMRHVPANQILLCADPLGAVHQAHELNEREARAKGNTTTSDQYSKDAKKSPPVSIGAVEYRKIYNEFWYILGHIALTEGGMATDTTSSNDFDGSSSGKDTTTTAPIVRLDAELVKNLILRIIELSPVGQPDVRAAATLAALSMSHAVLDQSAILAKKMDVASRQYAATKKNKSPGAGGAKAEALKVRMESLKRSVEDLEEVVLGPVVQGLFVHRYR